MKSALAALIIFAFPFLAAKVDPFAEHNTDFEVALKAAIGGLVTAVIALFVWFKASYARIERKLDQRDKERGDLKQRVGQLESVRSLLESCPLEHCPYQGVQLDEADSDP